MRRREEEGACAEWAKVYLVGLVVEALTALEWTEGAVAEGLLGVCEGWGRGVRCSCCGGGGL